MPKEKYVSRTGVNEDAGTVDTEPFHYECEAALIDAANSQRRRCYYYSAYENERPYVGTYVI